MAEPSIIQPEANFATRCNVSERWSAEYRFRLGRARKEVRKKLSEIEGLWRAQREHDASRRERKLMRSFNLRLVAAQRANVGLIKAARRRAKELGEEDIRRAFGKTDQQVVEAARTLNVWRTRNELVNTFEALKPSGGTRIICSFGIENRASQLVAKIVLENRPDFRHAAQMAHHSGGLEAVVIRIEGLISQGYKYAATTDITDCFGSICIENLPQLLKLPQRVVESVIGQRFLNFGQQTEAQRANQDQSGQINSYGETIAGRHDNTLNDTCNGNVDNTIYFQAPRRGIAQGSSCSPVVADYVMAGLLGALPDNVVPVCWVDDILILGKTRADVVGALHTLRTAAAVAPTGPFTFKYEKIRRIADGFEFVGWHMRYHKSTWAASPSDANLRKFKALCANFRALAEFDGAVPREAIDYLAGWGAAFRLWPFCASYVQRERARLEQSADLGRMLSNYPKIRVAMATAHLDRCHSPTIQSTPRRRRASSVWALEDVSGASLWN